MLYIIKDKEKQNGIGYDEKYCDDFYDFKDAASELLNECYNTTELQNHYSSYGDPINDILNIIDESNIIEWLESKNFTIDIIKIKPRYCFNTKPIVYDIFYNDIEIASFTANQTASEIESNLKNNINYLADADAYEIANYINNNYVIKKRY